MTEFKDWRRAFTGGQELAKLMTPKGQVWPVEMVLFQGPKTTTDTTNPVSIRFDVEFKTIIVYFNKTITDITDPPKNITIKNGGLLIKLPGIRTEYKIDSTVEVDLDCIPSSASYQIYIYPIGYGFASYSPPVTVTKIVAI